MKVLVGVDGSASAFAAVELAAREAAYRSRPLHIVHAFIWPLMHVPLGPSPAGPPEGGLRHEAERLLDEAVAVAAKTDPAVAVTTELVVGAPVPVLLSRSVDAELVVIGDRGLGGFSGLLVGSVAVQLASHSSVPVLVARGNVDAQGPIVVGVDGSPGSQAAVEQAFAEAALRHAALLALHAWTVPVAAFPGDMLPLVYDVDDVRDEEERLLAESLAGLRERYPDVDVTTEVVKTRAAKALLAHSRQAQLIVVGSRGRGGFTGLMLGSVSQQVLHHSNCPVIIVPS